MILHIHSADSRASRRAARSKGEKLLKDTQDSSASSNSRVLTRGPQRARLRRERSLEMRATCEPVSRDQGVKVSVQDITPASGPAKWINVTLGLLTLARVIGTVYRDQKNSHSTIANVWRAVSRRELVFFFCLLPFFFLFLEDRRPSRAIASA